MCFWPDFLNKVVFLLVKFIITLSQGAYPRVEHLKGDSHVSAPALPANIRLGCKSPPGTNTLAYYENL